MIERVKSTSPSPPSSPTPSAHQNHDLLQVALNRSSSDGIERHLDPTSKQWPSLPIPFRSKRKSRSSPLPTTDDNRSEAAPSTGKEEEESPHSSKERESGSVNFVDRYWAGHFAAWTKAIRDVHPHAIVFVQPSVFAPPPSRPRYTSSCDQILRSSL